MPVEASKAAAAASEVKRNIGVSSFSFRFRRAGGSDALVFLPALDFPAIGDAALRRQPVDHVGERLRELRQHVLAWHPGLLRQLVDRFRAERLMQLIRRDLLVGTAADPGIGHVAIAVLLELPQQPAEAAAHRFGGVLAELLFRHRRALRIAAEKTAKQSAQPAAGEKAAQAASLSAAAQKPAEPSPAAALPQAGSEQRKKRNAQRFGHSSAGYPRTEGV